MHSMKKAVPPVMQLSTFTRIKSIPSEKSYSDFLVTVRVKAPETTVQQQHAPVDIVAVIDVSNSMGWTKVTGNAIPNDRLKLVKQAMGKVIDNLGGAQQNRLALVAFNHKIELEVPLVAMAEEGQRRLRSTVDGLRPSGDTAFSAPLKRAAEILNGRDEAAKKNRMGFIIFLSDGEDKHFTKESIPREYPIHAFGVSKDHSASTLQAMAEVTSGSYTPIADDNLETIPEVLDRLSGSLSSIVAVDTSIHLRTLHPGVSLLRIVVDDEAAGDRTSSSKTTTPISDDKQSAEILVPVISISSGKETAPELSFTVYLYVPEGQGSAADGAMDLLSVGGTYKQGWDQKLVALGESVVAVARTGPSCKELEWIGERVDYWCKVKLDLSAMYDKMQAEAGAAESKCQCQVTAALREASLEAVDRAMHHDIYTAALLAIKVRHSRTGGATAAAATDKNTPSTAAQAAN